MNKINKIKVGGVSYTIPGSGSAGSKYDALFRRNSDTETDELVEGDFNSCVEKLLNNEPVNIVYYCVYKASSDGGGGLAPIDPGTGGGGTILK